MSREFTNNCQCGHSGFPPCLSGDLSDSGTHVPPNEGEKKEVNKKTLQKTVRSGSRSSLIKPKSMALATVSRPPDEHNREENVGVSGRRGSRISIKLRLVYVSLC